MGWGDVADSKETMERDARHQEELELRRAELQRERRKIAELTELETHYRNRGIVHLDRFPVFLNVGAMKEMMEGLKDTDGVMVTGVVLLKAPASGENFVRIVQAEEGSEPPQPLLSEKAVLSTILRETPSTDEEG